MNDMYTLRRISSKQIEMNQSLGEGYTVVRRHENPEEFREAFEKCFHKKHVADMDDEADHDTRNVYAFVGTEKLLQPIYSNQSNYIMTSNGQTFAKL